MALSKYMHPLFISPCRDWGWSLCVSHRGSVPSFLRRAAVNFGSVALYSAYNIRRRVEKATCGFYIDLVTFCVSDPQLSAVMSKNLNCKLQRKNPASHENAKSSVGKICHFVLGLQLGMSLLTTFPEQLVVPINL